MLVVIAEILLSRTITLPGIRPLAALLILLAVKALLPILVLPTFAALATRVALVAALLVLLTVEVLLSILILPTLIALARLAALILITHRPSPAVVVRVQDARK
ncbi:MAG: hypothetical protein ABI810_21945 [Sphingomonas bacterium]